LKLYDIAKKSTYCNLPPSHAIAIINILHLKQSAGNFSPLKEGHKNLFGLYMLKQNTGVGKVFASYFAQMIIRNLSKILSLHDHKISYWSHNNAKDVEIVDCYG